MNGAVPFSNNAEICEKLSATSAIIKPESNTSQFNISKAKLVGNTIIITQNGKVCFYLIYIYQNEV